MPDPFLHFCAAWRMALLCNKASLTRVTPLLQLRQRAQCLHPAAKHRRVDQETHRCGRGSTTVSTSAPTAAPGKRSENERHENSGNARLLVMIVFPLS